jgi:hypothetical protein
LGLRGGPNVGLNFLIPRRCLQESVGSALSSVHSCMHMYDKRSIL